MERVTLQLFLYLMCARYVRPVWRGRRQSDNPFPLIPSAACRDRFLRWHRWFVFVFLPRYVMAVPLYRVYRRICLSWKDESSLPFQKSIWHSAAAMDGNGLSTWRVECYRMLQNVTECCKMLQNVTKCYRMLQNVTECYKMLQNVTECYRMLKMLQNVTKYGSTQHCVVFKKLEIFFAHCRSHLHSVPPSRCTDFNKCIRKLRIITYNPIFTCSHHMYSHPVFTCNHHVYSHPSPHRHYHWVSTRQITGPELVQCRQWTVRPTRDQNRHRHGASFDQ
jgi:hypothetical protein